MAKATVGSLVINIFGRTADFEKSFGQVEKTMNRISKKVGAVGKTMTASLTLPIVGIGAAAAKMAVDFDSSMNKIVSLVGVSREEVDGMRGDVLALASQFGKTGNEAAEALFFITSAGLRGAEAMDVLETSLKASAVGLGDVKVIADLLTSAINAYGAENISSAKAADILTAAVREGKLEATELAGSIGSVLPVASAMGVRFDEVAAAMAAMSRTGTNAAEGATQLKSIMTSILKPTKEAEEALEGIGLSADMLRQSLREKGLLATLELLTGAFEGNDAAIAQVFGNVRALTGVMDLMGANAEGTRAIFASLTDATGMLDKAFDYIEKTIGFRFPKAIRSLGNEMINFGIVMMPVVEGLADGLGKLTAVLSGLTDQQRKYIVIALGVVAAVGPLLLTFAAMAKGIAVVATVVKVLAAASMTLVGSFAILGAAAYAFGKVFDHLFDVSGQWAKWMIDLGIDTEKAWFGLGDAFKNIVGAMGAAALEVALSIRNAFSDAIKWITDNYAKMIEAVTILATKIPGIGRFFGSTPEVDGARAAGGPVSGGSTYLVGEQGPELFTPSRSGSIVSNSAMQGIGGDGNAAILDIRNMLMAVFERMEA